MTDNENLNTNRIVDAKPLRRTLQPPTAEHLVQAQRLYSTLHTALASLQGIGDVPTGCVFTSLLWVYIDFASALTQALTQDTKADADSLRALGWCVAQAHEFKQEIADLYAVVAARHGIRIEDGHDPLSTHTDIVSPKGAN